jgi:hypothetical protein
MTAFEAFDAAPVPTAFFAATVNVYVVPLPRPERVALVTAPTATDGCAVAPMYGVIA